jgi:hypothetical protein
LQRAQLSSGTADVSICKRLQFWQVAPGSHPFSYIFGLVTPVLRALTWVSSYLEGDRRGPSLAIKPTQFDAPYVSHFGNRLQGPFTFPLLSFPRTRYYRTTQVIYKITAFFDNLTRVQPLANLPTAESDQQDEAENPPSGALLLSKRKRNRPHRHVNPNVYNTLPATTLRTIDLQGKIFSGPLFSILWAESRVFLRELLHQNKCSFRNAIQGCRRRAGEHKSRQPAPNFGRLRTAFDLPPGYH